MGTHPYYLTLLVPSIVASALLTLLCAIAWVALTMKLEQRRWQRAEQGWKRRPRLVRFRARLAAVRIDDEVQKLLAASERGEQ